MPHSHPEGQMMCSGYALKHTIPEKTRNGGNNRFLMSLIPSPSDRRARILELAHRVTVPENVVVNGIVDVNEELSGWYGLACAAGWHERESGPPPRAEVRSRYS